MMSNPNTWRLVAAYTTCLMKWRDCSTEHPNSVEGCSKMPKGPVIGSMYRDN